MSAGEQDDHAPALDPHLLACNRRLLRNLDDVLRSGPGGIDGPIPAPPRDRGQLKVQTVPVHVEHGVEIGLALESAQRECQATSVGIVPAWLVELGAVPCYIRQAPLIQLSL